MKGFLIAFVIAFTVGVLTSCSKYEIPEENCFTITSIKEERAVTSAQGLRISTVVRATKDGREIIVGVDPTTVKVGQIICN